MRTTDIYRHNLADIRAVIQRSCERSGRRMQDVRVIGVTKTVAETEIAPLLEAGVHDFGENRWQQAKPKFDVSESSDAVWHFIGRLQQNKVKYVVPTFSWIHSIDCLELGQAIEAQAEKWEKTMECLIQVNVSGEHTKSGVPVDIAERLFCQLRPLRRVQVRGFMTMAPAVLDIEETRPVFRELKALLLDLQQKYSEDKLTELSMGMSDDFSVAVEEGATMVRIGRRLMEPVR